MEQGGRKSRFEPENKETLYFAGVYRMEKGVPRFGDPDNSGK